MKKSELKNIIREYLIESLPPGTNKEMLGRQMAQIHNKEKISNTLKLKKNK
jgi:hypothetical protein